MYRLTENLITIAKELDPAICKLAHLTGVDYPDLSSMDSLEQDKSLLISLLSKLGNFTGADFKIIEFDMGEWENYFEEEDMEHAINFNYVEKVISKAEKDRCDFLFDRVHEMMGTQWVATAAIFDRLWVWINELEADIHSSSPELDQIINLLEINEPTEAEIMKLRKLILVGLNYINL